MRASEYIFFDELWNVELLHLFLHLLLGDVKL